MIHSCSSRGSGDDSRLSPVADGLCPVCRPVSQQAAFGGPRRIRTRIEDNGNKVTKESMCDKATLVKSW